MKILFINSLYAPDIGGGAEIILQRTVEGLQQRGHSVAVLATTDQPGLQLAEVNRVKVYRAGLLNRYWHFMAQRPGRLARLAWHWRDRYNADMREYVERVMELEQPELVVCHNLTGWSVSAWDQITQADCPIVQVLHDFYLLCPASTMFRKGKSCQRQCTTCTRLRSHHAQQSEQVSAVVGVSRFMLDTLQAQGYFKGARGYVVHNASPFTPAPREQPGAPVDTAPLRFGYLGTLSTNKGLEWLIEQFQRLPFKATLQIAGRGQPSDEKRFRTMVTSPDISFVGLQRPDNFYRQIDVAIVPSMWNEPFGMVAVEACAHSLPVIASRMGGLTEIIQEPLNGLLCSPDDPDSLGLAMLRLHQQPELLARLGSQARSSVASLMNLDLMLDQYESIFAQTLQDRST
ncbi:glycosyltransferase family 4 protein [Pseudomonas syringae]|uniref:glycosyltransferase family 4 protein n=1 Tax=Pseudomonas syringae TaxID=317 RepID=UPI00040E5E68|nr:glycosyltransferase family 4 protein [Pseudomonas syringae]QGG76772.1 glycosyltransferase [Pseudomonas syringae USA011]